MTYFESVLALKTPKQGSFKIRGQVDAARSLVKNPVIEEAVEVVSKLDDFIDRCKLLELWSQEISIGAKIVVTNWWGGISHFNRPRFYTDDNFEILTALPNDVFNELSGERAKILISRFFPSGDLHLKGIGISFFTKYFQFSTHSSNTTPFIIADKWTLIAVMADSITKKQGTPRLVVNAQTQTVHFKELNAASYLEFNAYFVNRANELGISPFLLEEKVFGWQGRKDQNNNPRKLGKDIIF
jgi:hypothetical protein